MKPISCDNARRGRPNEIHPEEHPTELNISTEGLTAHFPEKTDWTNEACPVFRPIKGINNISGTDCSESLQILACAASPNVDRETTKCGRQTNSRILWN